MECNISTVSEVHEMLARREKELQAELDRIRTAMSVLKGIIPKKALTHLPQEMPDPIQGMSYPEAAQVILEEVGEPLHVSEIMRRLRSRGYRTDAPDEQFRNNLQGAIARRARKNDTFKRHGGGTYSLLTSESRAEDQAPRDRVSKDMIFEL